MPEISVPLLSPPISNFKKCVLNCHKRHRQGSEWWSSLLGRYYSLLRSFVIRLRCAIKLSGWHTHSNFPVTTTKFFSPFPSVFKLPNFNVFLPIKLVKHTKRKSYAFSDNKNELRMFRGYCYDLIRNFAYWTLWNDCTYVRWVHPRLLFHCFKFWAL